MSTAHSDSWEDARKAVHQTLHVIFKLVRLLRLTAVHPIRNKRKGINNKRYPKERISLSICCWNVRTLLDREASSQPERRTALVTRELQRLNIDVAALSETHLSDEDQLTAVNSGFTIIWVGKPKCEKREGEVGFAIRSTLIDQLECPTSINDRIMKLRVPLSCGSHMSILFVYYDPTLQASEDTIMSFYGALREAITSIPKEEKLLLLGDFNARVGRQHEIWEGLGRYGIGNTNNNGLNLFQLCSKFSLAIKLQVRKKTRMEGMKVPKRINVTKVNRPGVCQQLSDTLATSTLMVLGRTSRTPGLFNRSGGTRIESEKTYRLA